MNEITLFREQQRFRQWWIWLLILGVAALQWWGFIQQIVFGQPWGNNPGPDWMMWLFWLLFGIGLPLFFVYLALIIEVTPQQVSLRFRPFARRNIPLAEIVSVEMRTYQALREFGGFGVRGSSENRAYNVSGRQGVQLVLRDGRRVLIGSQKAAELALAINSARRNVPRDEGPKD